MKQYRILNSVFGWVSFAVAAFTYLATIEPTASFWDCGEFIATSYKLMVGHPPGAAFFMIMGRLFTMFAGSDLTKIPITVNVMSALASAFTILFLFWSITHLAKKMIIKTDEDYTLANSLAVVGAGLVGALAYTFTDSFWFSAVEGEVYASSALFTALVFWAILRWENVADEPYSNRWLILIAYLMGVSTGVHLLNLLVIPAIVFIYYFKKYPITKKGIIYASIASIVILGGVMYGIIQGLVVLATKFELVFVNGLGLPMNSGVAFYLLALIGFTIWGLFYTYKNKKIFWNTVLLVFAVMVLGYSSVAMLVIRSKADTSLNENDPSNPFGLLAYLNREQYGDRPLFNGPTYNAPIIDYEQGSPVYTPINGKYVVTNHKMGYKYDERFLTFFPRMFSQEADHIKAYKQWADIKGEPIQVTNNKGKTETIYKPTFGENLKFFISYQIGFMYLRYFMWNFAGRQNDMQGHGDAIHGNWISGINALDEMRLGNQDDLPDYLAKNKARNKYFLLPLILGLIGMYYQYTRHKPDFTIVMLLFFMTGLAIVLYLNQTPYQPRERDYAYAGSFYAFAFWIGFGVLALYEWLGKKIPGSARAIAVTVICTVAVPGILAKENWDDHDRSNRYTCRDFAFNYLNSCEKDGIIFTNGDNDTFPLWYIQEVEGIRTDVRVVNLSYLGADWYIDQMERKTYDSDPVPFSLKKMDIIQGTRDIIYLVERTKDYIELKDALEFVASNDERTKSISNYSEKIDYFPSKNFKITVDTAAVFASGTLPRSRKSEVVKEMKWSINRNYITKSDLMVLDLLAHNNWKRPVYFAITVSHDNYLNLDNYFQITGLAYRLMPINSPSAYGDINGMDTKIMYENMMNKFKWGGINNPKVYLDENNMRMLSNFRNNFSKLAEALINEGKMDSARKVLDRSLELMPNEIIPFNYFIIPVAENYYRLKDFDKANGLMKTLFANVEKEFRYYNKLKPEFAQTVQYEHDISGRIMGEVVRVTKAYGQDDLSKDFETRFQMVAMNSPQMQSQQPQQLQPSN